MIASFTIFPYIKYMQSSKKSKETVSISLGLILGIVAIVFLVPFSFYVFKQEGKRYVKQAIGPNVKGVEEDIVNNIGNDTDTVEQQFLEENRNEYFVRIGFEGVYRTISGSEFSSLLKDGDLDKENFDKYISRKIIPYFEKIFGERELVKNSKGEFYSRKKDILPNYASLYDKIDVAYSSGLVDIRVDIDGYEGPGTDGQYAEKYMEVDNSQQKLYVWKNGKVEKVIGLSGPVYGFQVYGVFPIVDKGRQPIAPGGKYMPYWMAFYYSRKQDSWYGLHGLIWMYKEDGSKWFEPEKNIYTRQSAGCIRMVVADAKYLYENFQKGDLLLIHE